MDKYTAIWLSHSSISTFKACPRAYYLSTLYRDPTTHHKISLVTPSMSLGSAVHEVLESLSNLPTSDRFKTPLLSRFETSWAKVTGKKGGFTDPESELRFKHRGEDMLRRVMSHPGPLVKKAVKIKGELPQYWLSEEDNLMLCGKLDWLEYVESDDTVKILDFKTGVGEEAVDSLQLPIYYLLAHNCQSREVVGAAYWYIGRDDMPVDKPLPDLTSARELVLKVGKEIKLARALERFKCPGGTGGCRTCQPLESIIRGEATFVGTGSHNQDLYMLMDKASSPDSEVL